MRQWQAIPDHAGYAELEQPGHCFGEQSCSACSNSSSVCSCLDVYGIQARWGTAGCNLTRTRKSKPSQWLRQTPLCRRLLCSCSRLRFTAAYEPGCAGGRLASLGVTCSKVLAKCVQLLKHPHWLPTNFPNRHCTQALVQETQHGQDKTLHTTHRTSSTDRCQGRPLRPSFARKANTPCTQAVLRAEPAQHACGSLQRQAKLPARPPAATTACPTPQCKPQHLQEHTGAGPPPAQALHQHCATCAQQLGQTMRRHVRGKSSGLEQRPAPAAPSCRHRQPRGLHLPSTMLCKVKDRKAAQPAAELFHQERKSPQHRLSLQLQRAVEPGIHAANTCSLSTAEQQAATRRASNQA